MLFQILLIALIGISLGIVTGLIPGIHVNLISILLLSLSNYFLKYFTPLELTIIIASMAITHTFLDVIPSIYLGAPDSAQILSVLPGHKLLLQGKAYEAISLTVIGSLSSLILASSLTPFLIKLLPFIYLKTKNFVPYLLIIISTLLILRESKKVFAFFLFTLSGILGLTVLNSTLSQPLFPLLSGLFGTSGLLISLNTSTKIPKQKTTFPNLKSSTSTKSLTGILISGTLASFLPGLGPAQAAVISSSMLKNLGSKGFLILTGGLSTINMLVSFITLHTIQKARNGAVVIISKILENVSFNHLIIFISISLITAGLASLLTLNISKIFSKLIPKINYKILVISIIAFITLLTFIFDSFLGLLVLITSTSLGLLAPLKNVSRHHLMGCLMLPVIFFLI